MALTRLTHTADVGRLERPAGRRCELAEHRLRVDRVPQARAEGGDGRLGVVAGAVEAAVDEPLQAARGAG